ncbi:MAG: class I SAM-dependent methyltransferase [Pseudomonadota bacterium]
MPSSTKARQAIIQLAYATGTDTIFELGSGWGNLLIPLAKAYPERKIIGYELSLIPFLVSVILKKVLALKNVHIYRQNFLHADLARASVIICYLFPEGMQKVEEKLNVKNAKHEYLISNTFALPSHKPSRVIRLNDLYKSPVYLYKLKR